MPADAAIKEKENTVDRPLPYGVCEILRHVVQLIVRLL